MAMAAVMAMTMAAVATRDCCIVNRQHSPANYISLTTAEREPRTTIHIVQVVEMVPVMVRVTVAVERVPVAAVAPALERVAEM